MRLRPRLLNDSVKTFRTRVLAKPVQCDGPAPTVFSAEGGQRASSDRAEIGDVSFTRRQRLSVPSLWGLPSVVVAILATTLGSRGCVHRRLQTAGIVLLKPNVPDTFFRSDPRTGADVRGVQPTSGRTALQRQFGQPAARRYFDGSVTLSHPTISHFGNVEWYLTSPGQGLFNVTLETIPDYRGSTCAEATI
jgi:hypothetical protein